MITRKEIDEFVDLSYKSILSQYKENYDVLPQCVFMMSNKSCDHFVSNIPKNCYKESGDKEGSSFGIGILPLPGDNKDQWAIVISKLVEMVLPECILIACSAYVAAGHKDDINDKFRKAGSVKDMDGMKEMVFLTFEWKNLKKMMILEPKGDSLSVNEKLSHDWSSDINSEGGLTNFFKKASVMSTDIGSFKINEN